MGKKLPTIKEIARRLNISVSTVSRALHDHPSIGSGMKMKVRKLAKELKYEPHQGAIALKQGKSNTLGVILPNLHEQFFSIAINGIEDAAQRYNYNVFISQSHENETREKQLIETFRRNGIDGILVSISKNTNSYNHFQELKEYNIPLVFFDRVPPLEEIYSVSCSLKNSTVAMIDILIKNGHSRIGFINGPGRTSFSKERVEGYVEGLRKNGLKMMQNLVVHTDLTTETTENGMKKLFSVRNPPTAVIAFNDYVALDAIRYIKKQGYKVNKDVCFASYANLPITNYLDNPPFLSVEQFPYHQAERATEMLLSLITRQPNELFDFQSSVVLESEVVYRDLSV